MDLEIFTQPTVGNHFQPSLHAVSIFLSQTDVAELLTVGSASCSHMFSTKLAITVFFLMETLTHIKTQLLNMWLQGELMHFE